MATAFLVSFPAEPSGVFFGHALDMDLDGYKPLKSVATKGKSSGCSNIEDRR